MQFIEKVLFSVTSIWVAAVTFDVGQHFFERYWRAQHPTGFAVDGPEYFLPGLHIVFVWPLFVFLLLRLRWLALTVTLSYLGFASYSIWLRLDGCFLGGEICPPKPLVEKLLDRLALLEWIAFPFLLLVLALQIALIIRSREAK